MFRKLLIGIVFVAIIAAVVMVVQKRSSDQGSQLEADVRRATIGRGEIVVSVTATGSIVPKAEVRLTFDLSGKVANVNVETGDFVRSGGELARLDDSNLILRLRQAEAALAAAQAQLDQLEAGPRPPEVAAAQANLHSAEAGVDGAEASKRELEIGPDADQIAAAEANLAAAQAVVDGAKANLRELETGPDVNQVAAAEANLAAAQGVVDGAKANLRQLERGSDVNQVAAAEANLRAAEGNVLLATLQRDQLTDGASADEIAAAEAQVAAALLQEKTARDTHDMTMSCQIVTLPDGGRREVCPALGTIEEQARYNLSAAQAALEAAQAQLDRVLAGPTQDQISSARANIAIAEAQRDATQAQLDQLRDAVSAEQLDAAKANIATVSAQRDAAQAQLDQLRSGVTAGQLDAAEANVAAAMAQRDAAQAQLDQLLNSVTAERLQAAQANVSALAAQRDGAQAQLDLLLAGASSHQIAVAQSNVDQAQVALEMIRAELDAATLVAPYDGVVTAVNVQADQLAPVNLPAVTLADLSGLEIVVNVDEIDVARIVEGQAVMITVDALPNETVSGLVKRIAPAATQLGGVVVYEVTILLEESDLPLRVGMSATAAVTTEQLGEVLLVPNWAIRIDRDTGKTYVNLLWQDSVEEAAITVGVRGEDASQVLAGLQEGDVVVAGDVVGLRTLLNRED